MLKKASLNEKLLCDIANVVETEHIILKNTLQNLGQQEFAHVCPKWEVASSAKAAICFLLIL